MLIAPYKRTEPENDPAGCLRSNAAPRRPPEMMSRSELSAAYFRLARRYHPDAHELMANINAARTETLRSYRPSS